MDISDGSRSSCNGRLPSLHGAEGNLLIVGIVDGADEEAAAALRSISGPRSSRASPFSAAMPPRSDMAVSSLAPLFASLTVPPCVRAPFSWVFLKVLR